MRGFQHTPVGDITKKAGINRGTFYKYYVDKMQLIEQTETRIVSELQEIAHKRTLNKTNIDDDIIASIKEALRVYERNIDFLDAMLSENGDLAFERRLYKIIVDVTRDLMPSLPKEDRIDEKIRELIVQYQASSLFGILSH